jgi:hypothetical protein
MNKLSLEFYLTQLKRVKTYQEYVDVMNKIYSFHRSKSSAVVQKIMKGEVVDGLMIQNDYMFDCAKSVLDVNKISYDGRKGSC